MRKFKSGFLSSKISIAICFLVAISNFVFSQEPAATEGADLSQSLNVVIAEVHKPKFQKTPTVSSNVTIEDSDMTYKYYATDDEWMQIAFHYSVDDWKDDGGKVSREEKKLNPIVPEITFKVFVEGIQKGGKKESTSVLLVGEATYINVRKTDSSNKYRYGIMFIPPELVEFYGLKELHNSAKGNIRIEAYIGDKKAVKGKNADESYKDLREKDETWDNDFKKLTQVQNTVFTKDLSPWFDANREKFPMLKPKGSEKK
ncbi:MAG: hypothetical protein V4507_07360 [Verrucomicrobiota bacterium]